MGIVPLLLVGACITSPLDPSEQARQDPGLNVAPATVWLPENGEQTLSAWLTDESESDDVVFTWSSSDPGVVQVDAGGVVRATGRGTAKISVEGGGKFRDGAVTVTVTTDDQEAKIAAILGVPRLESVWGDLSFSRQYDEKFEQFGDTHFAQTGGDWESTYYDRGLVWYAAWWRTGEGDFLARADVDVKAYRDDYVLPNDGRVPPRWVSPEGLAIHYILTGDAKSLEAIRKMADATAVAGWLDNMMETSYLDGRIQGRTILSQIIAYQLTGEDEYRERARRGFQSLVEWYESTGANGSWDHPTRTDVSYCGGMATFQITHAILDALVRYRDVIDDDSRILPMITRTLDYTWGFWEPGEGFAYIQPPEGFSGARFECSGSGSSDPAPDLSLLILTSFGEAYRLTGEQRFLTRGDQVLEFGLSGSIFLNGYKQFNQSFMRSFKYLYFAG